MGEAAPSHMDMDSMVDETEAVPAQRRSQSDRRDPCRRKAGLLVLVHVSHGTLRGEWTGTWLGYESTVCPEGRTRCPHRRCCSWCVSTVGDKRRKDVERKLHQHHESGRRASGGGGVPTTSRWVPGRSKASLFSET